MTKRDYFNVAYALRNSNPREVADFSKVATDGYFYQQDQWMRTVEAIANHLGSQYVNFKRGLFLAAAGYSIKPDGSLWHVDWHTDTVPNWRSL